MYQILVQADSFVFLDQIYPKKVFAIKERKSEHHHRILHIWISLSIKFQLKLTTWVFGPNLPKKGTTEQNNQSSKLQEFAFCVVTLIQQLFFNIFEISKISLFWTFWKRNWLSIASWARFTLIHFRMARWGGGVEGVGRERGRQKSPLLSNSQILCYTCVKF